MAGWTGLEPAASDVTGRRYNQLNYHPNKKNSLKRTDFKEPNSSYIMPQTGTGIHFCLK